MSDGGQQGEQMQAPEPVVDEPGETQPLPPRVVTQGELVDPVDYAEAFQSTARSGLELVPRIPDDATLEALSLPDLAVMAKAYGLPAEDRETDIAGLKKIRDTSVEEQQDAPASVEMKAGTLADLRSMYDPANPREFDPTVVLLHLERDGVIVEGFIDPYTGAGTRDLLVKLQDELVIARSREDGAAPAYSGPVVVGESPDPNALKRQRAAALGHDIDPETKHCRNCNGAEWWCLEGNPCIPKTTVVTNGEVDHEEA